MAPTQLAIVAASLLLAQPAESFTARRPGLLTVHASERRTTATTTHMQTELGDALSTAVTLIADSLREVPGLGIPAQPQNAYVPPDQIDNFPQIVAGSAAGVLVYLWALYEFGSRIVTQRACAVCNGSGLVSVTRTGRPLTQPRKCYACGGFLPWESWGRFWVANKYVGNGGILRRPAADYYELNAKARAAQKEQAEAEGRSADHAYVDRE